MLQSLSFPALAGIFLVAATFVWWAGWRLSGVVDGIARKTGLSHAFSGMLVLGGITSLPEIGTVSTASAAGNPELAVNNLIGSASMNLMLLVAADLVFGRDALTSAAARPGTLMQGVLGMMLLAMVGTIVTAGDVPVAGVGVGTIILTVACIGAMRMAAGFERGSSWEVTDRERPMPTRSDEDTEDRALRGLITTAALLGAVILVAGFFLSTSADAMAQKAGISAGMVGFVLVGFATSLPELSTVTASVRAHRYEMAVGDIFGTNLFNILLLLLADAVYAGEPVLKLAGSFEGVGAMLALLLTGTFTMGLLERWDRTFLRMGYDAVIAIPLFATGLFMLWRLSN